MGRSQIQTVTTPTPHFVWPPVDEEIEQAVLTQLHTSVSIYDRSVIFARFEDTFRDLHGRRFACLFSSGTAALHAAFQALQLTRDDEVICPAYTFFATITPALWTGASVRLCETDEDGNIDPRAAAALIGPRTRAIVVTHMWGMPARVAELRAICDRHGIALIEDCSHAHGASTGDRLVGTLGDIAIWSLQGPKTVSGGEGGILVTDDADVYYRTLLFGHYNKRTRQEIPESHRYRPLATTGWGLKLRAHPLAVAIANVLLSRLGQIVAARHQTALRWRAALANSAQIELPDLGDRQPSWYAFTFLLPDENSRDEVLSELVHDGLAEADKPGSTMPLNLLPLFQGRGTDTPFGSRPDLAYRRGDFPMAEDVWSRTIKLPVFLGISDRERRLVSEYAEGLSKVALR